jgi:ubiquinol-cytochrome c reductase cytochrome c subunit
MPVFGTFTPEDINDVAKYIGALNEENTTGPSKFGGAGPVAEGLAAWLLGLIPLVALTRWIGRPRKAGDAR